MPQGIRFLGYATFISHLLGTAAGGAFIYAQVSNDLGLSCLLPCDIKGLLIHISGPLGVNSGGYKDYSS